MIVTFAYTNLRPLEDDIEKALLRKLDADTFIFELDVAEVSPLQSITPIPLKWDLLDGQRFSIKTRKRAKQSLRTKPNLVLNGAEIKRSLVDYKTLLDRWFHAHSRWIKTDTLTSTDNKHGVVKVVPTHDELVFEKHEGKSFLILTNIEFETQLAS